MTEDVIALSKQYNANGADELLVFDLSDSDEDHEESIDLIKKINRIISIPMVAGGNIRRAEDVKKLARAGVKRTMLEFFKKVSIDLVQDFLTFRKRKNSSIFK